MNEDKELKKLSDGMPICKHGIPLDSDCDECYREYILKYPERVKETQNKSNPKY